MREINVKELKNAVVKLCVKANIELPCEIENKLKAAVRTEKNPLGKEVISDLISNTKAALSHNIPICQDTGMAVVFLDIGQDVHLVGGDLTAAINSGIAQGYKEGLLRMSTVIEPLFQRENAGDNTPGIIYTNIVEGDKVKITLAPKGFGSENMSRIKMFNPSVEVAEIVDFVVDTVELAGGNPCPPITVGVGIGGDFEYAAFLSKKALCRSSSQPNSHPLYRDLEEEMLRKINLTGIGPQGFGGSTTALYVNIEYYPTHIAGLPVAVNIGCHVTRHKEIVL
ncbi:MAG: fumarate hydratase [Oscillospiraceae bacterium]|nr:fumarate hydratase [Oscillospiraceae bacterium]